MVASLPLLPAQRLYRGLTVIRAFSARKVEPHITVPQRRELASFFTYVETKWLDVVRIP